MLSKETIKTIENVASAYLSRLSKDKDIELYTQYINSDDMDCGGANPRTTVLAYYLTIPLSWIANKVKSNTVLSGYAEIAKNSRHMYKITTDDIFDILSKIEPKDEVYSILRGYYTNADGDALSTYLKNKRKNDFCEKIHELNNKWIFRFAQLYKDINDAELDSMSTDGYDTLDISFETMFLKSDFNKLIEDNKLAIELCIKLQVEQEVLDVIRKILSEPVVEELFDWSEYYEELKESSRNPNDQIPSTFESILLTNISNPSERDEKLAELMPKLKTEIVVGKVKGQGIAYIITALKNLKYIPESITQAQLYRYIKDHFKYDIGDTSGADRTIRDIQNRDVKSLEKCKRYEEKFKV